MQHLQATTQPNKRKRKRSNMRAVVGEREWERVRMKASNSDGYFFVLFQRVEWHHNKSRINEAYTHRAHTMNNSDFACME